MTQWEIRQEALVLIRAMAGDRADRYVGEILLPTLSRAVRLNSYSLPSLRECLNSPFSSLEVLFGHYAFSRRGKDRFELSSLAVEALHRTSKALPFEEFLREPDASFLWENFVAVCQEKGKKPLEQLNRGVIQGLAELAQEIKRLGGNGSIAHWVYTTTIRTDRIEPQFMRMVDIRGVGPKLCSLFIRDMVFLYNLEDQIDHVDRLYVQPVDKHIRAIASYIIDELGDEDAADWVLAGKIAKYTRRAGVSGIRFNMGTTYLGMREAPNPAFFDDAIQRIISGDRPVGV